MIHFEVPDHKYDLLGVRSCIELIKDNISNSHEILDNVRRSHLKFVDEQLNRVGDLSMPAFELRDSMERAYLDKYGRRVGRRMFIKHYEGLHAPYDELKEEIFTLIEKLDPQNKGY